VLSSGLTAKQARWVLQIALAAIVLAVFTHTRADPDLWGHVRFGEDMVAARTVHVPENYSFVSDRPWVNHEWLAEVIMYESYRVAGGVGLIILKLLLLIVMLTAVIVTLRDTDLPRLTRDLLIGLVVISTIPQANHVRPQLFSLALFAWLLASLTRTRQSTIYRLLPIPILILWSNVHGGWIVGAGTLLVWAATGLLSRSPSTDKTVLPVVAVVAVAATILNPYGWRLWQFLGETVGFSRPDIVEWQPIYRLDAIVVILWSLVAVPLAAAIWRGVRNRSLDLQSCAMPLLLAVAAFRVSRLQAFFAISVVMLMAAQFRRAQHPASVQPSPAKSTPWPRMIAVVVVALAIISGSLKAASDNIGCVRMDSDKLPEPSISHVISDRGLRGRMLTWFSWGEYAIWHWGREGILVSMDGRRETVYSNAAVTEHLRFYFQPDARHAIIDRLQPDFIWLPAHLKVIDGLRADGWRQIHSSERSVLLAKEDIAGRETDERPYPARRCFPGP
jgi:hypothetical protein